MTELRHFVNFALEEKRGKIVLALSESVNGDSLMFWGSQSEDMRSLEGIKWGTLRRGGEAARWHREPSSQRRKNCSNLAGKGFVMA